MRRWKWYWIRCAPLDVSAVLLKKGVKHPPVNSDIGVITVKNGGVTEMKNPIISLLDWLKLPPYSAYVHEPDDKLKTEDYYCNSQEELMIDMHMARARIKTLQKDHEFLAEHLIALDKDVVTMRKRIRTLTSENKPVKKKRIKK